MREKRLLLDLSLRKFSELIGMDASHWSKIERDILPFTEDHRRFSKIANLLEIKENGNDWFTLLDLASISRKEIPEHVYNDAEVLRALPIFFRTANKVKPTEEELNQIIKLLTKR